MRRFWIAFFLLTALRLGWSEPSPLSLSLPDAIRMALEKSPDLKSAQARLQIAYGMERETKSEAGIQVTAHGLLMDTSSMTMIPTVSGVEPSAMFMVPTRVRSGGSAVASFPLFTGGRISGLVDSATHNREAEEFRFEAAKVQLAYAVKIAYGQVLVAQKEVAVEERVLEENQDALTRIKTLLESGKVATVQLYRANAEFSNAKRKLVEAQNGFALRKIDLLRILGTDLSAPIILTDSLVELPNAPNKEALIREAELNRPELLAKKKEVAGVEALVRSAKGDYFPQTYFYGRADTLSGSPGQFNGTSFGLIATFPIFDSGKRGGKVEQAEGKLKEAHSDLEALTLNVRREVTQGWLNLDTARVLLAEVKDELKSAEENLRITRLRFESGKAIQLEILDALSVYERARLRELDARFAYHAALALLDRAVGRVSGSLQTPQSSTKR